MPSRLPGSFHCHFPTIRARIGPIAGVVIHSYFSLCTRAHAGADRDRLIEKVTEAARCVQRGRRSSALSPATMGQVHGAEYNEGNAKG